jgi:hypothetical protein
LLISGRGEPLSLRSVATFIDLHTAIGITSTLAISCPIATATSFAFALLSAAFTALLLPAATTVSSLAVALGTIASISPLLSHGACFPAFTLGLALTLLRR